MASSVKLDEQLKSRVKHLAQQRNRSPHWIMCEAIRDYVDREEKRESFKLEALASWKSYLETGQHVTLEEAGEWLQSWGSASEGETPECHGGAHDGIPQTGM